MEQMRTLSPLEHIKQELIKFKALTVKETDKDLHDIAVRTLEQFERRGRLAVDYFLSEELFYDEQNFRTTVRYMWVKYKRG